jgi:hypothetical protein
MSTLPLAAGGGSLGSIDRSLGLPVASWSATWWVVGVGGGVGCDGQVAYGLDLGLGDLGIGCLGGGVGRTGGGTW